MQNVKLHFLKDGRRNARQFQVIREHDTWKSIDRWKITCSIAQESRNSSKDTYMTLRILIFKTNMTGNNDRGDYW